MTRSAIAPTTLSLSIKLGLAAVASVAMLGSAAAENTTRMIVHYKSGAHDNAMSAIHGAKGKMMHEVFGMNAMAVEVSAAGHRALKNSRHITFMEPDVRRFALATTTPSTGTPYLSGQLVPYGIPLVQADKMPSGDANASNRKICIIDSGYDLAHPDLNGNSVTGEYDSGTGNWSTDENHHGTHVAGTIAAINNSGVGVVGVNPNQKVKLHIVKVFGPNGWAYSSTLSSAANKCAAAGANIISMSLGGASYSATENSTFASLAKKGILSIAAAGNDGNTTQSYPAGYTSVVSVAAVDENKQWATFSQYTPKVELSGPGVAVLSSVPVGTGSESKLAVGTTNYVAGEMTGSPKAKITAPLADFGIGDVVNSAMTGKVCLIARGTIAFGVKVANCQASGGVGAIVYNNVAGALSGTLGTTVTTIPSITASDTDGAALKLALGQNANVQVNPTNYAFFDGTSMATPHVSAVAALVWSYFPTCTADQIRTSLGKSALDLDAVGRDNKTGFGLVQARAAYDRIKSLGCGK
jgi:subtilisin family serine protease